MLVTYSPSPLKHFAVSTSPKPLKHTQVSPWHHHNAEGSQALKFHTKNTLWQQAKHTTKSQRCGATRLGIDSRQ